MMCRFVSSVLLLPIVLGFARFPVVAQTGGYGIPVQVGTIVDTRFAELSGIVASRQNPGVLWVHNDRARGDIVAVSTNGAVLAIWRLNEDVDDLEDIAIGPGPAPEVQYLYCGDVGDNAASRSNVRVYRVAEPAAYAYQAAAPASQSFPLVERFNLEYPDGAHNAEEIMVDPLTGDLFIATKEVQRCRIYLATAAQLQPDANITLTLVADLGFDFASAGDIRPDGQEILLRQENFARVWRRSPGQTVAQAFASAPIAVPVVGEPREPNGEGVAYAGDGQGYYTVSEGSNPALYFFASLAAPPSAVPQFLVRPGSSWRYLDDGSDQVVAWRAPDFNDSAWRPAPAQFGYGEEDEETIIRFGANEDRKVITTYFRTQLQVADAAALDALTIRILFDDGAAVYLNGVEVLRRNLADNASFSTPALTSRSDYENIWHTFAVTNVLRNGTNTLAVEVHRFSRSEADLSFDLQFLATPKTPPVRFKSAPRKTAAETLLLELEAAGRTQVSLEASTNLTQWTQLKSVPLTNGAASATVPSQPLPYSFFRLRQ